MIKVLDATFITTATKPEQYPLQQIPEVAFVGRSNVGKSSMINTLAQRKKLVRVSNTPGRTRTLNFFDISFEHKARKRVIRLCDLPGYGFAKASKGERESWRVMIESYLRERHTLKLVVCIIDGEIGPTPDDLQMIDVLQEMPPKILVAATKLDRLPNTRQKGRVQALTKQLDLPEGGLIGFSATERIGVDELWRAVLDGLLA
jgi:GTP-binding protein